MEATFLVPDKESVKAILNMVKKPNLTFTTYIVRYEHGIGLRVYGSEVLKGGPDDWKEVAIYLITAKKIIEDEFRNIGYNVNVAIEGKPGAPPR